MTLAGRLGLEFGAVVALVGSGGKTACMMELAASAVAAGGRVVVTTTTKMYDPGPGDGLAVVVESSATRRLAALREALVLAPLVVVTAERLPAPSAGHRPKLAGIPPDEVALYHDFPGVTAVLVEADGARGRSLKGYLPGEPVIPRSTAETLVIVGLDGIGLPCREPEVPRAAQAAAAMGLQVGECIGPSHVARLVLGPGGYLDHGTAGRVTVVLNKADTLGNPALAEGVAAQIRRDPRVHRVLVRGIAMEDHGTGHS